MQTFEQFLTALEEAIPDPQKRGKAFEPVCKWLLETHPIYSSRLQKVWLWDDWPGRWGSDAGIDLIAVDVDGLTWAIQSKCFDAKRSIPKGEIDKFLSESIHESIDRRLLIATTDRLAPHAQRVIRQQDKVCPISTLLRTGLIDAPVHWPHDPILLIGGEPRKRWNPRPHQKDAIKAVRDNLKDRGQLIMACGTGKTLTALWAAEALGAQRTLVLLPSLTLLSQTVTEWLANATEGFAFLPVCSDASVSQGDDAAMAFTTDLAFPVTTDAREIRSFLQRQGRQVVFSTYQSSGRVAEAMEDEGLKPFDLVIADEAHRCAGKVSSDYGTVLDAKRLPARKRLFMTATPRTFTDRVTKKAAEAGLEMASMDDEALFGPVIHELSFAQAIKNKLLTNYQVVVCGVDDARVRDAIDVGRMVETESGIQTDAATLAGHIAVARAMKRFGLRRTISFHSRVRKAKEFVNTLPKVCSWMGSEYAPEGEIVAGYVSGDMPVGRRNTKLNGLRQIGAGQHGLLANARCLSEGVDVPTLDGVAFIDPRRSQVDIVQAVGRAIRKADGKTLGTILIPVYLGDGEDADAMLAKSAFKPVWDVVRALRSHDVGLGEALDGYRVEIGRSGRMPAGLTGDRIILDIPERIGADFVGAFELQLVERSTSAFQFGLGVLRRFVEREGHAQVPKSWIEIVANGTHNLGMWCSTRRYDAKRGLLGKERLAALDSLGFDWDPYETGFQTGLAALQQFIEREGNADVPHGHVELSFGAPFKLGVWCSGRRSERKQGRLTDQRIAPLDGLQFVWDPYDAEFQYGLAALEQFVEREGNVRVRKSHIEVVGGEDFKLGSWCSTRRIERTHGRLTDERILSLDALGFEWDPMEALFQRGLLALQLFVEREGHARVPQSHVELVANEPFKLGSWCSTRRLGKKKGSLTDERIAAIDKLGFDWDPAETSFQEGIIALRQFIEREGHASVLQKHVEVVADSPFNLGRWFLTQRNGRKKGRQTIEHIAALDALGFDWDPIETVFQRAIAALRQFVEREGHTRVPLKHVEVVAEERLKLGIWCNGRRQDRTRGRLAERHIAALDALTFDWDPRATAFGNGLLALRQFKRREGHARVPRKHVEVVKGQPLELGNWCTKRRSVRNKERLSKERIAALDTLGFDWDPKETAFRRWMVALKQFVEREGHTRVPLKHVELMTGESVKLGIWCNGRRQDRKKGRLVDGQVAALDSVSFDWDPRQTAWQDGLVAFRQFVRREGHGRVPGKHVEEVEEKSMKLGSWCTIHRAAYNNGRLLAERVAVLEESGFYWGPK